VGKYESAAKGKKGIKFFHKVTIIFKRAIIFSRVPQGIAPTKQVEKASAKRLKQGDLKA